MRSLSKFFYLLGVMLIFFSAYLVWQRHTPTRLSFDTTSVGEGSHVSLLNSPSRIRIERLNIDLPIIGADLEQGKWKATDRGVSYLTSTALPGEMGNSVLYGHNWPNLLGRLVNIKPGDLIEIQSSDGSLRRFRVAYTTTVTPDQTHILAQTDDARLTIYTCSGFLDSKRFVATAILEQ